MNGWRHSGALPWRYPCSSTVTSAQLKVLWGRSGGCCARCRGLITAEGQHGKAFPLAEQAHMVARSDGGPRGEPDTSEAEREDATNYILLCPNCHTHVDKNHTDWPVERLRKLKAEHEAWVAQRGEQVPLTELSGLIEVVATNSDVVEGVVVQSPTRIRNGTRVSVRADGAKQVTGMVISSRRREQDEDG